MDSEPTIEQLVARYQAGDDEAFEQLLKRCKIYLERIVSYFNRNPASEYYEDVVQQARIGLSLAAKSFKFDRGCKFLTYAILRVRGSIQDFLRMEGTIKVPRLESAKHKENGWFQVERLEQVTAVNDMGYSSTLGDLTEDVKSPSPVTETLETEDRDILFSAISAMPPLVQTVLIMRLEDATMKQIAAVVGLSESRISQSMPQMFSALGAAVQAKLGNWKGDYIPLQQAEYDYMFVVRKVRTLQEVSRDLKRSEAFCKEHGQDIHGTIMISKEEKDERIKRMGSLKKRRNKIAASYNRLLPKKSKIA